MKLKIIGILSGLVLASVSGVAIYNVNLTPTEQSLFDEVETIQTCDGTTITSDCVDENGIKYTTYIWHEAEAEVTKQVYHPFEPAKTHTVHHDAVYGYKTTRECVKTTIDYKHGTCALSKCRDGQYSGSTGKGTCSYHGGVAYSGGPWYTTKTTSYIITEAWDEVVVDTPSKAAWTETVVVAPAKEAYLEAIPVETITEVNA